MTGSNLQRFQIFSFGLLLAGIAASHGQEPPAELVLKGKVRDFIEGNRAKPLDPHHPHFFGDKDYQTGCSSQGLGVSIVNLDIDTTDLAGDTSVFRGDHRGPRLVSDLDPRVAGCYDPVSRFADWYNDVPGD